MANGYSPLRRLACIVGMHTAMQQLEAAVVVGSMTNVREGTTTTGMTIAASLQPEVVTRCDVCGKQLGKVLYVDDFRPAIYGGNGDMVKLYNLSSTPTPHPLG